MFTIQLILNCREAIPVDMMGKNPLCMNQYFKLLCSCRIPQPFRDDVFIAPKGTSKHVVVAYKNEVILHILVIKFSITVQNGKIYC